MTIRDRLVALDKQRAALAQTVSTFEAERQQALAGLPTSFGFKTLDGFIKAVKDAAKPAPKPRKTYSRNVTRPARPRKQVDVAPVGALASVSVTVEATVTTPESPASEVPANAPLAPAEVASTPVGSDLNDATNFGLLPDAELLSESASPGPGYYDRLAAQLGFARKVLGTSGVPAAVWRQWRSFEQKAGDILRERNQASEPA